MVRMVLFITYLLRKADRLLEGEGVPSESGFAGRLLAEVYVRMVFCMFQ